MKGIVIFEVLLQDYTVLCPRRLSSSMRVVTGRILLFTEEGLNKISGC
jgi:hypothetical protein